MILDIFILALAFGSGIFGIYYAIKLRILSNKTAMEDKQRELEVVRIFKELDEKSAEINPQLMAQIKAFNTNKALEDYTEYVYSSLNRSVGSTNSNHVLI